MRRGEREGRGGGWMATNEILEGLYWNPEDGGGASNQTRLRTHQKDTNRYREREIERNRGRGRKGVGR